MLAIAQVDVMRLSQLSWSTVAQLLARFGIDLQRVADAEVIPGSYWGECEAGLIGNVLYCRMDTPIHSVLHESSHFICMDARRRAQLHTDAGGDHDEENAVCWLQLALAEYLPEVGRARLMQDMDAWGYTFRLGSTQAWYAAESADARAWLSDAQLIDAAGAPRWRVRI